MKEITLQATIETISVVTAFIDEALEAIGCPVKVQMQIDVAMDELFGNIARYAYAPGQGDATVRFDFDEAARTIVITLIDGGIPFDPLSAETPDISRSAQERQIGGLGIFLVRKTMDGMDYSYRDGKNILTFRKRI